MMPQQYKTICLHTNTHQADRIVIDVIEMLLHDLLENLTVSQCGLILCHAHSHHSYHFRVRGRDLERWLEYRLKHSVHIRKGELGQTCARKETNPSTLDSSGTASHPPSQAAEPERTQD